MLKMKRKQIIIHRTSQNIIHTYRILTTGDSGSEKINQQPDIDKIYIYTKDSCEAKYQFLINKRENTGSKHLNDSKAFIEYSNDIDDIYRNIEEYNLNLKKRNFNGF